MAQQFGSITHLLHGVERHGVLSVSEKGIEWTPRSSEDASAVLVKAGDIQSLQWVPNGRTYQLKVLKSNGSIAQFQGFRAQDSSSIDGVSSKSWNAALQSVQAATKGWNWGVPEIDGNRMTFTSDDKAAFEVDLKNVTAASLQGKNEVALEFLIDDTADDRADQLIEMRMFVPSKEEGSIADFENAEAFRDEVLKIADVQGTGECIVAFEQVPCLVPRGRYDIELYRSFFKMHGTSYDFKISFASITRLFLLPKPDGVHADLVVSVDPPVRQGNTFYPHLVLHLHQETAVSVDVNMSSAELKERYGDVLTENLSGTMQEVLAKVFKALSGKRITIPGRFKSHVGASCVRATVKASDGHLYPLEKSFVFIPKPPTYVRYDDIVSVEFGRVAEGTYTTVSRSFDLIVHAKNGQTHQFTNISRDEYSNLFSFIQSKDIRIKNLSEIREMEQGKPTTYDEGSEESDEDYEEEEGEKEHDPYLSRMQAEGELDSEEEDEDFRPSEGSESEISEGSAISSGEDDDSDEDEGDSDGDDDFEGKKKSSSKKSSSSGKKRKSSAKESSKSKKAKKTKDPNAPKRAKTAYFFFMEDKRDQVRAENPDKEMKEIVKILGAQWKELSDDDKATYMSKAEEDKARYAAEKKAYDAKQGGKSESDEEDDDDE